MTLRLLFTYEPRFYAAISSCLSLQGQSHLSRVSKKAKELVDSADYCDYSMLKLTLIYENCKEQIEQLNGPWRSGQEVMDRLQSAAVILDQELKNSCKSMGIVDAEGGSLDYEGKTLSIMQKVKIAGLIDTKNAGNLIYFFQQLATQIPEAQSFQETLNECKTIKEKAQLVRTWMQANREVLAKITTFKEMGEVNSYFKSSFSIMPVEVFLLDGLDLVDFYKIIRYSLRINCPCLIREIIKNPRLLTLEPKWLGSLLEQAALSGASQFISILMNTKEFSEIPDVSLIRAFENICQQGNLEILRAFTKHSRFSAIIDLNMIGRAVIKGVEAGSQVTVDTLVKDSRFDLINIPCLTSAIFTAIKNRQPNIAKTLLSTKSACSIEYDRLMDVLETAYDCEMLGEFESFFKGYGNALGNEPQNLSLSLDSILSDTDPRIYFVQKAKGIISKIREGHEDMGCDSDSEMDEEMSSKENLEQFIPRGKRYVKEYQTENSPTKRRKTPSPKK